jgi:hypothetical protein
MNLICSGVGPERGYENSVRIAVYVRGAEISLPETMGGVDIWETSLLLDVVRDMARNGILRPEPLVLLDRRLCPNRPVLGEAGRSEEVITEEAPDASLM